MPIFCDFEPKSITKDEYHTIDYEIMSFVFDIHKDLGRFFDERVYQNELVYRCEEMGFDVRKEAPIHVVFKDFKKTLLMDIVIDECIDYELKTVERIASGHRRQVLNYLLLGEMNFGKLVNMRPPSVEAEYVTTSLTAQERRRTIIDSENWCDRDNESSWLKDCMISLIGDWGVFLDASLYSEAVCHFLGGEDKVIRQLEVTRDGRLLGLQRVHLLNETSAFMITACRKELKRYEFQLRKLLKLTRLEAIQWINLNHHDILFKTLH